MAVKGTFGSAKETLKGWLHACHAVQPTLVMSFPTKTLSDMTLWTPHGEEVKTI